MALNKDWKDYDPVTETGDPSTPLTAAALEDLEARAQAAIDAAVAALNVTRTVIENTSSYTLDATYSQAFARYNSLSAGTATIPVDLNIDIGKTVEFHQWNFGKLTIVAAAGVTLVATSGRTLTGIYAGALLTKTGTNEYLLTPLKVGDLEQTVTPLPDPTTDPVGDGSWVYGSIAGAATGAQVPVLPPMVANCTVVMAVGWDGGTTDDIFSTLAATNWTKRTPSSAYGTDVGVVLFTRFWNGTDTFELPVLTWTGGDRGVLIYALGAYPNAVFSSAPAPVNHATVDSSDPTFAATTGVADGKIIAVQANSAGLTGAPPSGYTEQAELSIVSGTLETPAHVGTPFEAEASNASSIAISAPSGASAGQRLVLSVAHEPYNGTLNLEGGWELIPDSVISDSGMNLAHAAYTRVWDGSALANVGKSSPGYIAARMIAVSGTRATNPVDVADAQVNASSGTIDYPELTTTIDNTFLVAIGIDWVGQAVSVPSGFTDRTTNPWDNQLATKVQATAGSTGTVTSTHTAAASAAVMIALAPAGGGGTLALQVSDNDAVAGSQTPGTVDLTGADRSWVTQTLAIQPAGNDPPTPPLPGGIQIALNGAGTGVIITGWPSTTPDHVTFANLPSVDSADVTYTHVAYATASAGGYTYTPPAGRPVVSAVAKTADNIDIGAWTPRLVTTGSGTTPPPPNPTPSGLKKGVIGQTAWNSARTALVKQLGATWTRTDTPSAAEVAHWAAQGITMLPIAWGDVNQVSMHPQLTWFEYWNEPYYESHITPQSHAQGFKNFVIAARQINPNVKCLISYTGWAAHWTSEGGTVASKMVSAVPDLAQYISGIAVHPYTRTIDPSTSGSDGVDKFGRVDLWRSEWAAVGVNVPFWITEIGWTTNDFASIGGNTTIATYMDHLRTQVEARPWIEAVMIFQVDDQVTGSSNREHQFGLYTDAHVAKAQATSVANWYGGTA